MGFKDVIFDKRIQLYVNEETREWKYNFLKSTYSFDDVLSCEILENGITSIQTTTKSKVSLSKAAGAIIGGTAGKSYSNATQTDFCSSLKVKITLKKIDNPCIFIDIIKQNINKNTLEYEQSYEIAQKIISIFQIIIDDSN